MTEAYMPVIRADHGLAQAAYETRRVKALAGRMGDVGLRQGLRRGFWDGVAYVLNLQHDMENLTAAQLVAELRKGDGSIYWPVKSDDPRFWDVCDRCRTRQLFDAAGICPNCGMEVED